MNKSLPLLLLLWVLAVPFSACEKEEEAQKVTVGGGTGSGGTGGGGTGGGGSGGGGGGGGSLGQITGPVVIMGELDGTPFSITPDADIEAVNGYDGEIGIAPDPSEKTYSMDFWTDGAMVHLAGASFGRLIFPGGGVPTDADFFAFFNTGSRTYGDTELDPNVVQVTYTDPMGIEWSTDCGSGAQSGSSFEITDKEESTGWNTAVKIRATFNCTLYSCAGSATHTITNGVMVLGFENL